MKPFVFILFFVLGAYGVSAQSVTFQGVVQDSLAQPLEMANVLAVNAANNETESFCITNEKGFFKLALKKNTTYRIQASFIGFEPYDIEIKTEDTNITQLIKLKKGIELEGLEIVHEIPVRISGDTMVYNSDSFTNGTERKLEDVLKKMPGVEVNDDGTVSVQGKKCLN